MERPEDPTIAIPEDVKARFNQLLAAAREGELCLVEVTRSGSKSKAYAICVATREQHAEDVIMVPVGEVPDRDPFSMYVPPEGVEEKVT